jgi:CheY-like chemotaxis protein
VADRLGHDRGVPVLGGASPGEDVVPVTALVVDDDPDMRGYLRSCLRGLGPRVERVVEAADGLEALALVRSGVAQLVLADSAMPGLDGQALCRAIKGDPALRHVGVLLISGVDDPPPPATRADGFLAKPFNASQLGAAVERLLPGLEHPPAEPAG